MKNKITNVMAVVMAAIFLCCSGTVFAELSNQSASKDYRNMLMMNRQGVTVNKPGSRNKQMVPQRCILVFHRYKNCCKAYS